MKKIKPKTKTVLLIGLDSNRFGKQEDYKKYANKIGDEMSKEIGISNKKLPIIIYDKSSTTIDLLEIKL
jgi:hypothetical protein